MTKARIELTIYCGVREAWSERLDRYAREFGAWTTSYDEAHEYGSGDVREKTIIASKFTDRGKLSKQDASYGQLKRLKLVEECEAQLAAKFQVESETEADMKEAVELARIINENTANISLNEDNAEEYGYAIKTKMSRSKWYDNAGELNSRSQYTYYVAKEVAEQAKRLHEIRRKHQGNRAFDFFATEYKTVVIRTADH